MKLSEFDFQLPDHLIAQHPLPERDQSRLMLVRRASGEVSHHFFHELPEILRPQHFIVLNKTRVFPARLWARRPGREEEIEILLVEQLEEGIWRALVRPGRKARPGESLQMTGLRAEVVGVSADGTRTLRFDNPGDLMGALYRTGRPPLPPYIRRSKEDDCSEDRERYQTVFAKQPGSVAAPTAGLHFTPRVLERLSQKGCRICEILLHVGYGTFKPVRCQRIEDHRMDPEYFEVEPMAAECIARARSEKRSLLAVGTTVTRTLEHLAREGWDATRPAAGHCDLFIYPGHQFRMVDALLTNFHLPRSTLFMLVCAFAGRERMLECYRRAIEEKYRFFSYGDCMLIM